MPLVSKRQLARDLGVDRETLDRWIARYREFPIAQRGSDSRSAWQFDPDAVRQFMASVRAKERQMRDARLAAIQAVRCMA